MKDIEFDDEKDELEIKKLQNNLSIVKKKTLF
jgi:hypothetical protein